MDTFPERSPGPTRPRVVVHFHNWKLVHHGKEKVYKNNDPVNVLGIKISHYNHESCVILISGGHKDSNALSTSSESNRQLLETDDLPVGTVFFRRNEFILETSAEELAQILPQILDALQEIEPSISAIRDDVMDTFPERLPGPEITG